MREPARAKPLRGEISRDLGHPREHLDAAGVTHGIGMSRSAMAATDKPDDRHASRVRGYDAAETILDYQTSIGADSLLLGGVEKQVRCRLYPERPTRECRCAAPGAASARSL